MNKHLVLDLETDSKKMHKRSGSSWYNKIVAIGLKSKHQLKSYYIYDDQMLIENLLSLYLEEKQIIVGHNIKFDLLHLWNSHNLQSWLKAGGKIWDTQYAHYTLTSQQDKYPSLREIAVKYYGCPERPKYIEDLLFNRSNEIYSHYQDKASNNDKIAQEIIPYYWNYEDISDLPKDLVLKDVEADVLDTESIYLQQVDKAKQLKMYDLLVWSMDSILATTEMEANGMMIDKEIMDKNKKKLELELQEEYNKLNEIVQKYWI